MSAQVSPAEGQSRKCRMRHCGSLSLRALTSPPGLVRRALRAGVRNRIRLRARPAKTLQDKVQRVLRAGFRQSRPVRERGRHVLIGRDKDEGDFQYGKPLGDAKAVFMTQTDIE